MRLFWRKGYAGTSVEDLIGTLNLSRSSLYDTFGDKRTLFLEALKFYSERVISGTAQTLNKSSSPIAGIQTLFDELIGGVGSDTGALGCFMVNSVAELVPKTAHHGVDTGKVTEYVDQQADSQTACRLCIQHDSRDTHPHQIRCDQRTGSSHQRHHFTESAITPYFFV